jgi:hypothetical protein
MSCSVWNAAGRPVFIPAALIMLSLPAPALHAQSATTNLSFADGKIACEIVSKRAPVPELLMTALPIAMSAALEHVGAPPDPVHLTLRIQETPPFYKRAKALFRLEAFAIQENDEILLRVGEDPLKLAFRIAHELSHWLVSKRHEIRPPLWLDEGLANLVGASAADTCARTLSQSLERPLPPKLDRNLFALDELIDLQAYPTTAERSAAFYWQAEALVAAIRKRLGPADFTVYLGLLSSPAAPDWRVPLRERWYFSDWDFNWLAQQIRPPDSSGDEKP